MVALKKSLNNLAALILNAENTWLNLAALKTSNHAMF